MRAQIRWVEKVQDRLRVTSAMLSDMKAVKMLGLSGVMSEIIQSLRRTEIKTSKAYRKLLIAMLLLCGFFGLLGFTWDLLLKLMLPLSSFDTDQPRTSTYLRHLHYHSHLLEQPVFTSCEGLQFCLSDHPFDNTRHCLYPNPSNGCPMFRKLRPYTGVLQL